MTDAVANAVKSLIEKGKARGYLTYEEMNNELPPEAVEPDKLDALLMNLDELGIDLIDESDVPAREKFADGTEPVAETEEAKEEAKTAFEEEIEVERDRIDDPVRMYLTQMGEIPLLSRDQEIALAKKIEMTRMHFRRRVLESDYCAGSAVDILQQVGDGDLPFDRTMKISTAENMAKDTISQRIPTNIETVRKVLEANRILWKKVKEEKADKLGRRPMWRMMWRRRRRVARLLEELSLRTSR